MLVVYHCQEGSIWKWKMNDHILIIDNDKSELRKLRQILSREGYSIMTATNIETAESICKNLPIKYVLGEKEFFNFTKDKQSTKINLNDKEVL